MFYKKHMQLNALPLVVACVVFSTWAVTSLLLARSGSSPSDVFGGPSLAGCIEPCDDSTIGILEECQHLSGDTCEDDACMVNRVTTVLCEEGEEEDECEYHTDPNQWARWETHKEMYCPWEVPGILDLGDCGIMSPQPGQYVHSGGTPCWIDVGTCVGDIFFSDATVMGRPLCGDGS